MDIHAWSIQRQCENIDVNDIEDFVKIIAEYEVRHPDRLYPCSDARRARVGVSCLADRKSYLITMQALSQYRGSIPKHVYNMFSSASTPTFPE